MRFESYNFATKGGWVDDTLPFDLLQTSCLVAHGLGRPVVDAVALINLAGDACALNGLCVWALTRDWVSPKGPGRFVVVIVDQRTGTDVWTSLIVGCGVEDWHWEPCGRISGLISGHRYELHLRDLTGFDARCAGVVFQSAADKPPCLRRTAPVSVKAMSFDFVVIGGGYAGMCAAVSAARSGARVALVQDRPVWGGNASSEVRVGPIGGLGLPPFPQNSNLAYELMELTYVKDGKTSGGLRPIIDNEKLAKWLAAEKNLTAFSCTRCVDCKTTKSLNAPYRRVIVSVVCDCWRTGERVELSARHFADCTGDGTLAVLAGADYREVPEMKAETGEELAAEGESKGGYGSTNFWTTRWTDHETTFPACPWALQINETNWEVNRPRFYVEGDFPYAAGWNWESGFDKNPFADAETIRDYNLRAAYGMWDYLKNKAPNRAKYAKAEMDWLGLVLGKRAARRVLGDYILCEQDLTEHREQADGVVTTTWFLDLHFPHPANVAAFPEGPFRSMAYDDPCYKELVPKGRGRQICIRPYAIPLRCLYSRNVENLWMAGKNISCTHVAMSSVRVENTTAQMGAVVGCAASCCMKNGWTPRQLAGFHFDVLARELKRDERTWLSFWGRRRHQGRNSLIGELKFWLRPFVRKVRSVCDG